MFNPEVEPGDFTELDRFIFESWGYLVIPGVLTKDEADECYEASRRLHSGRDHSWGQVGRGYETEPSLERLIDHPAVLPKVRGLYGDRFLLQASWNTMQPAGGDVGGWHQDGSSSFDFNKLGYSVPLVQLRASFLLTDPDRARDGQHGVDPGQPPQHRSASRRDPPCAR